VTSNNCFQLPLDYDGNSLFALTIRGEDAETEENIFTETTRDFRLSSKALSIFIQTDKAIYQPGELSKCN